MLKALLGGLFAAFLMAAPASAQTLTFFLGTANLEPLAHTPTVLNIEAQSATKTPQFNVNLFDDFFLINGNGKLVVNFNYALANKGQKQLPGWIGVAQYSNHEILMFDLQFGFELVKTHFNIPNAQAAHVVIYKTLNTGQLVYDYAVPLAPHANRCQEYLFTPAGWGYQLGMQTSCYWSLGSFGPSARLGTAGMRRH